MRCGSHVTMTSPELAREFMGKGRILADEREEARALALLVDKYRSSEDDLREWGRTAIPIAIDLT